MQLTRPLVSLDIETDDMGPTSRLHIVELGFRIDYPDGREPKRWRQLFNPGVPIAKGAFECHGISDVDVAEAPPFSKVAPNLAVGFRNCDYCGYNVTFDLQVIQAEMDRAKVEWNYKDARLLDGLQIWRKGRPRTLSDAVREFLNREPTSAHRALGDAEDAREVALAMLERFSHIPQDLQALHDLCFPVDPNRIDAAGKLAWKNGEPVITFGKHKGVSLRAVPRGYLEWMVGSDFPSETKQILEAALGGKFPERV